MSQMLLPVSYQLIPEAYGPPNPTSLWLISLLPVPHSLGSMQFKSIYLSVFCVQVSGRALAIQVSGCRSHKKT